MDILISNTSGKPIYEQITSQIKAQILSGELGEGDALPRISVITTKRAYEDLERDGFVITVPGKGSFVAAQNTDLLHEEALRQTEDILQKAVDAARRGGGAREELLEQLTLLWEEE